MPRMVNIKVPAKDKRGNVTHEDASGYVAHLNVGGTRVRFLIQTEAATETGHRTHLTHYASGFRLVDISSIRLGVMANLGPRNTPNDRYLAQSYLDQLVAEKGAETVLAKLASVPAINS